MLPAALFDTAVSEAHWLSFSLVLPSASSSSLFRRCSRFLFSGVLFARTERSVRNLVLSICEFRLQAVNTPDGKPGRLPGSRVGSQLLLLTGGGGGGGARPGGGGGGTELLLHGGADEYRCFDTLHSLELGNRRSRTYTRVAYVPIHPYTFTDM